MLLMKPLKGFREKIIKNKKNGRETEKGEEKEYRKKIGEKKGTNKREREPNTE